MIDEIYITRENKLKSKIDIIRLRVYVKNNPLSTLRHKLLRMCGRRPMQDLHTGRTISTVDIHRANLRRLLA